MQASTAICTKTQPALSENRRQNHEYNTLKQHLKAGFHHSVASHCHIVFCRSQILLLQRKPARKSIPLEPEGRKKSVGAVCPLKKNRAMAERQQQYGSGTIEMEWCKQALSAGSSHKSQCNVEC